MILALEKYEANLGLNERNGISHCDINVACLEALEKKILNNNRGDKLFKDFEGTKCTARCDIEMGTDVASKLRYSDTNKRASLWL